MWWCNICISPFCVLCTSPFTKGRLHPTHNLCIKLSMFKWLTTTKTLDTRGKVRMPLSLSATLRLILGEGKRCDEKKTGLFFRSNSCRLIPIACDEHTERTPRSLGLAGLGLTSSHRHIERPRMSPWTEKITMPLFRGCCFLGKDSEWWCASWRVLIGWDACSSPFLTVYFISKCMCLKWRRHSMANLLTLADVLPLPHMFTFQMLTNVKSFSFPPKLH